MAFYTYRQNNSGGFWCEPAKYVIVEAPSANVADAIAEDHGVYFDGCDTGMDCPCCGDRWHRAWSDEGHDEPTIYGEVLPRDATEYKDDWGGTDDVLIIPLVSA